MIPAHDILDALAHRRRRCVCEVLAAADRKFLPLSEVTEQVVASPEGRTDEATETVKIKLHHVHLPKLDEAGLLEYDHETNAVYYERDPVVEAIGDGARALEAARARVDAE